MKNHNGKVWSLGGVVCLAISLLVVGVDAAMSAPVITAESPEVEIITAAQAPGIIISGFERPDTVLIRILPGENPIETEYAMREEQSQTWVDPAAGRFGAPQPKWATYAVWGGEQGIVVEIGAQKNPLFRPQSRNMVGEVSVGERAARLYGFFRASRDTLTTALESILMLVGVLVFALIAIREFLLVHRHRHRHRRV